VILFVSLALQILIKNVYLPSASCMKREDSQCAVVFVKMIQIKLK
jgi:hypothetical protein